MEKKLSDPFASKTVRKVFYRLMPLLVFAYMLGYLDRVNISFAALTMNEDIGINPYYYGLGAGVFFWTYFVFEVPSNLMLERFGARRWIFRIMLSWGVVSAGACLISGPASFVVQRLLLGGAEAGFFPGVILYITYWFPDAYRTRIIASFTASIPIALALGGPLSSIVLKLNGIAGLHGWQWLFLVEGIPAVVFSFFILRYLPDRPRDAKWLSVDERAWLESVIDREAREVKHATRCAPWRSLLDPRVLALCFFEFANTTVNMGLVFFLPQIVRSLALGELHSGVVIFLPYVAAMVGLIGWSYLSTNQRAGRRLCLIVAFSFSAIGLSGVAIFSTSFGALLFMSIAAVGIYGAKSLYWPLPATFLSGTAMAGGIALINSVGTLGGFAGPIIVGWARQHAGTFVSGLYALSLVALVGAVIAAIAFRPRTNASALSTPFATVENHISGHFDK